MSNSRSDEMCKPRRATPLKRHAASDGWWYVNPGSIDVCVESKTDKAVGVVRLTKRQLKKALEIMASA